MKDYHQSGLQQKIAPIAMDYAPGNSYLYAIRYKASDTQQLIGTLDQLWKKTFPGYDFDYFFLDQDFEKQYQAEQKLANVFGGFALTTILIPLIGLVGLVSMVTAKTKEIGVRKVLGAEVVHITGLLSKNLWCWCSWPTWCPFRLRGILRSAASTVCLPERTELYVVCLDHAHCACRHCSCRWLPNNQSGNSRSGKIAAL